MSTKLQEQQEKFSFLLPENMKKLGFNCTKDGTETGYYQYKNDGTKHYNKDYNPDLPEPKGKVVLHLNINYTGERFTNLPFLGIGQDGDSRTVFKGAVPDERFLISLLSLIR